MLCHNVLHLQFFATSKDISIGPVAVMSLTVSQIIKHVNDTHPDVWSATQIATTIALLCGLTVLGIGLLRLGWLVEFIPAPAVSGFMTGSAISIVAGQVPGLLGLSGFECVFSFVFVSRASNRRSHNPVRQHARGDLQDCAQLYQTSSVRTA